MLLTLHTILRAYNLYYSLFGNVVTRFVQLLCKPHVKYHVSIICFLHPYLPILVDRPLGNGRGCIDRIHPGVPRLDVFSLGAHSYLTKPLDVKFFIQLVEELLSEKEG